MTSIRKNSLPIPARPMAFAKTPGASRAASVPHAPRFAGQHSFIVPDRENIFFVPGMGSPKKSVAPLAEYFERVALPDRTQVVRISTISQAQTLRKSVDGLSQHILQERLTQSQARFLALQQALRHAKPTDQAQVEAVRGFLSLDGSPQATRLAEAVHRLMTQTRLPEQLIQATPDPLGEKGRVLEEAYAYLVEQLPFTKQPDSPLSMDEQLAYYEKPIVQVFDKLAPRITLIGHSLGGIVGFKTLLENHRNDVNLVISLGSPLAGTTEVPDAMRHITLDPLPGPFRPLARKAVLPFIDMFFKAVPQLRKGSHSIEKLQNTPQPVDTTAISVANPKDGLVSEQDSYHNLDFPGRINLTVSPLPAKSLIGMLDESTEWFSRNTPIDFFTHSLARLTPFVGKFVEGMLHHCGLVENWDAYWSDQGQMNRLLFDGVDSTTRIRRLLHPQNYEGVRTEVLTTMLKKLSGPQARHYRDTYRPLKADLQAVAAQPLPFANSADKLAQRVLDQLAPAAS